METNSAGTRKIYEESRIVLILAVMATAAPALAQTSTWVPDKAHSSVSFSVLHLGFSKVRGRFGDVGGTININEADITKSVVHVTINVSTVDTGEPARDGDLKGPGFFEVEHYPIAIFSSTTITKHANELEVIGNLTLHGITKPVTLHAEGPLGPVTAMDHKPHSGFSANAIIDRTAFSIGTRYPAAVVGDDVALTIDLDVAKQ